MRRRVTMVVAIAMVLATTVVRGQNRATTGPSLPVQARTILDQ